MALTFYYGSGSPFSWRVFLALEHKGLIFERRLLSFAAGEHKTPEFLAINPRHKLPAITDGEFKLYESAAIVEYLDDKYPDKPALLPRAVETRAIARRMIQEVDEYLARHTDLLAQELWFSQDPKQADAEILARAVQQYLEEIAYFERELRGDFMLGELSAVDFALYPFLAQIPRYERVKPDLGLRAAYTPKIAAWMQRIQALPYYERTYPPHWRP